jgi:anti-sigma factor (TIGR02949 family)
LSETSCEEILADLEHYLRGELPPDRAAHLARHLDGCSPCLDHAEFQRRLWEIVRRKCRTEAPDDLVARVREALRRLGEGR